MALSADTPFIVFGDDWGRHVSTMQHIFRHIVTRYPVVWVNSLGHRVPRASLEDMSRLVHKARAIFGRRQAPEHNSGYIQGPKPLAILNPAALPLHHIARVHEFNDRVIRGQIISTLAAHRLTAPPIVVTGTPASADLVGQFSERASVYFCMDDFLAMPGTTPWMLAPLERRLLQRVDALVATAESLTHTKRPGSGRAFHLPQGVYYEHFSEPQPEPDELRAMPHPRIGFAGSMKERCDMELLQRLADAFPAGSIVLVGPVLVDVTALRSRPNIHVLGGRAYRDLPGYVQAFDVGIIPYRLSNETIAVDPLKLLEYCAAGLPVVCTALPEARKYPGAVRIAATQDEFIAEVHATLLEPRTPGAERARALARGQRWELRADRLLEIIESVIAARGGQEGGGA